MRTRAYTSMPIHALLDFIGCRLTLMNADSAAHLLRRCELLVARQPDLRTVRGTRCDAWHPSNPTRHSTDEVQHECAACGMRRAMRHSHAARHVRVEEPPAVATAVVATLCDKLRSSSYMQRSTTGLGRTTWGVWCTLWVLCEYSACTACVLCERCGTTRLAEPLGVVAAVLAVDRTGDEYHRRRPKAVKEAWRSVRACTWVCCFVCCAILLVVMFVGRRPGSKSVSTVG